MEDVLAFAVNECGLAELDRDSVAVMEEYKQLRASFIFQYKPEFKYKNRCGTIFTIHLICFIPFFHFSPFPNGIYKSLSSVSIDNFRGKP